MDDNAFSQTTTTVAKIVSIYERTEIKPKFLFQFGRSGTVEVERQILNFS